MVDQEHTPDAAAPIALGLDENRDFRYLRMAPTGAVIAVLTPACMDEIVQRVSAASAVNGVSPEADSRGPSAPLSSPIRVLGLTGWRDSQMVSVDSRGHVYVLNKNGEWDRARKVTVVGLEGEVEA